MTDKNSVKINIPEGMEIDASKSTFHEIFFKSKEKQYPKTFRELDTITGFGINGQVCVYETENIPLHIPKSKSLYVTEEQAKASLALAQLTQLLKAYNGDWKPINDSRKYVINCVLDSLMIDTCYEYRYLLSFEKKKIADLFLDNFENLIKEASPLLFGYSLKD